MSSRRKQIKAIHAATSPAGAQALPLPGIPSTITLPDGTQVAISNVGYLLHTASFLAYAIKVWSKSVAAATPGLTPEEALRQLMDKAIRTGLANQVFYDDEIAFADLDQVRRQRADAYAQTRIGWSIVRQAIKVYGVDADAVRQDFLGGILNSSGWAVLGDAPWRKELKRQYAGADWILALAESRQPGSLPMSDLGRAAADLLGDVFQGIYHIDTKQMRKVAWSDRDCVEVPINSALCTVDFDHLTRLVVLAHDRMIRVHMQGQSKGWLRLLFHQRLTRTGQRHERYETIEDHAKILRLHYGTPQEAQ